MSKNTNFLKGLAIIAVVTIHLCSRFISSPVALLLDQFSRFAVPLFVAVSGYGLSKSFEKALCHPELVSGSRPKTDGSKNQMLKQVQHDIGVVINYYAKRVWKILPWFILASLIIMIFRNYWENAGFNLLNYHTWTSALLRGGADYHLYFVPMIFKLYLIFPLLFFAVKKFPKTALLLSLIWQIFLYWRISTGTEILGNNNQIWPDQMQYLAPETWIFYFTLGIYLSKFQISNFKFQISLLLAGFVLTFINAFILQQVGIDSLVATRFTRLPVLIYATGFILTFFNWQFENWQLAILGKYSYQIYLFHTIILRIILQ